MNDLRIVQGRFAFNSFGSVQAYNVDMTTWKGGAHIAAIAPDLIGTHTDTVVMHCNFHGDNSDGTPILQWTPDGPILRIIGMEIFSPAALEKRIQEEIAERTGVK